jgi:hypothetical protein
MTRNGIAVETPKLRTTRKYLSPRVRAITAASRPTSAT